MTHSSAQISNSGARVSGKATGALFFAGFGSIWLYGGLSAVHRLDGTGVAAVLIVAAALIGPAVRLLWVASKATPKVGQTRQDLEARRTFHRVNAAQWIACALCVVVLNMLHKQEFIAPVVSFIVGLHLFPLAKVFRYPAHYVTGALLVIWSTGVVAALPAELLPSIDALGAAVILLGSAAYTLYSASRAAKAVLPLYAASRLA